MSPAYLSVVRCAQASPIQPDPALLPLLYMDCSCFQSPASPNVSLPLSWEWPQIRTISIKLAGKNILKWKEGINAKNMEINAFPFSDFKNFHTFQKSFHFECPYNLYCNMLHHFLKLSSILNWSGVEKPHLRRWSQKIFFGGPKC